MKRMHRFIVLLLFLASCGTGVAYGISNGTVVEKINTTDWKSQLNAIKEDPISILGTSELTLMDYEFVEAIDDSKTLDKYRNTLKEKSSLLPYYDPSTGTLSLLTRKELLEIDSAKQKISFVELDKFIDGLVQKGMEVVRLTWNDHGTMKNTLCVVSDKRGIVYDSLIMNLRMFTVKSTETVTATESF